MINSNPFNPLRLGVSALKEKRPTFRTGVFQWNRFCFRSGEEIADRGALVAHGEGTTRGGHDDFRDRKAHGRANGGNEVLAGGLLVGDFPAILVGGAVDVTLLDAAAGKDGGVGFRIVVATAVLVD